MVTPCRTPRAPPRWPEASAPCREFPPPPPERAVRAPAPLAACSACNGVARTDGAIGRWRTLTPGTLLLRGRRVAVELGSGSRIMVLFERRSGEDRRTERRINEDGGAGPAKGSEDARWPLSFEDGVDGPRPRDPWAALVLRSIRDYSLGRPDLAQSAWDDAITWRVEADGPTPADAGAQAIHAYHRR